MDGNPDGLVVRRALLEESRCKVDVARSPEECLTVFETSTFDVVVTDYRLPRMTGKELISRIRQLNPDARVILLAGFIDQLGLTPENAGADALVTKGANEAQELIRWVKRPANRTARKPPMTQKRASLAVRAAAR